MLMHLRRTLWLLGPVALFGPSVAWSQMKASGFPVDTSKSPVVELREKRLVFPVAGASINRLKDNFRHRRGDKRVHNALDIPAPRGRAVLSTDSGRVIKLYRSPAGGLMIYATDSSERFIYYYAHLDRYRTGLREGEVLARGDTIGYVGTTGNAAPNWPHLHFAILRTNNVKRWSRGTPINPFEVFASE